MKEGIKQGKNKGKNKGKRKLQIERKIEKRKKESALQRQLATYKKGTKFTLNALKLKFIHFHTKQLTHQNSTPNPIPQYSLPQSAF